MKNCGKSLPNPPEGGHACGRSKEGIDLSVLPLEVGGRQWGQRSLAPGNRPYWNELFGAAGMEIFSLPSQEPSISVERISFQRPQRNFWKKRHKNISVIPSKDKMKELHIFGSSNRSEQSQRLVLKSGKGSPGKSWRWSCWNFQVLPSDASSSEIICHCRGVRVADGTSVQLWRSLED